MRPLTVEELLLAEDLMSGRISISLAKEAKALMKGAAISSQREKKRKRVALPDTRVMDNPVIMLTNGDLQQLSRLILGN